MSKLLAIKITILLVLLSCVTAIFALQDTVIRVALSKDTLIRNGRYVEARFDIGEAEWVSIQGETPYYSIYEYNIKAPLSVWRKTQQVRFEIGQVRRDDNIYIESISIEHPILSKQIITGSELYNNICDITATEVSLTETGLLELKVTATRAHTPEMSTEGPSFNLEEDVIKLATKLPNLSYILCMLLVVSIWMIVVFLVPTKVYLHGLTKVKRLGHVLRSVNLTDVLILLFGGGAIVLYYGDSGALPTRMVTRGGADYSLFGENGILVFHILSVSVILLVIKAIYSNGKNNVYIDADTGIASAPDPIELPSDRLQIPKILPYLFVLVMALIVYIPTIFPNPYFFNDEAHHINATREHLQYGWTEDGKFASYTRGWPFSWLVAQSFRLFGDSTASARAVTALCGVAFIMSVFHITKKMTKRRDVALMTVVLLLCSPDLIDRFQYVRVYALVMPVIIWLFYYIYKILHDNISYKKENLHLLQLQGNKIEIIRDNTIVRFIKDYFNFHFGYAALTIFFIYLMVILQLQALIILVGAGIYVFLCAILNKQHKYINLSIIGVIIILLFIVQFLLFDTTEIRIPFISRLVTSLVKNTGNSSISYDYFWADIKSPLGPYFGVAILFAAFMFLFPLKYKEHKLHVNRNVHVLMYPALCYLATTIVFVFFIDRYYNYRYMQFLAPITYIILSVGIYEIMARVKASTRLVIYLLIIIALSIQMIVTFSWNYIEKPERTMFDRPYSILKNDAMIEEVETIYIHSYANPYQHLLENAYRIPSFRGEFGRVYQIDYVVSEGQQFEGFQYPVKYVFAEDWRFYRINESHKRFLELWTDLVTTIDRSWIYKYRIIESFYNDADQTTENKTNYINSDIFVIDDIKWDNDTGYLSCRLEYIESLNDAMFIAIEIIEQGIAQSATHRYQILVPDDLKSVEQSIHFVLTIHPKTEEYIENITIDAAQQAYIYYGFDEAVIVDIK